MVYCPTCVSFGEDCSPDPEDYGNSCQYYKYAADEIVNPIDEAHKERMAGGSGSE